MLGLVLSMALQPTAHAADASLRIRELHARNELQEAVEACEKLAARGAFTAEVVQACADVHLDAAGDDLDALREVARRWGSSEAGRKALDLWSRAVLKDATDEDAIRAWPVASRGDVGRADAEARWSDALANGEIDRVVRLGEGFRGLRTPEEIASTIATLRRQRLLEGPLEALIAHAVAQPEDTQAMAAVIGRVEALGGLAFVPLAGTPGAGTLERLPVFLRPGDAAAAPAPRTDPAVANLVRTGPTGDPPVLRFVGPQGVVSDEERRSLLRELGLDGWVRDDLSAERYAIEQTCLLQGTRAVVALPVADTWIFSPVRQPEDCRARAERLGRSAVVRWGGLTWRLGAPVRDLLDARLAERDSHGTLRPTEGGRIPGVEIVLHVHADRLAAVEANWALEGDFDSQGIVRRLADLGGSVAAVSTSRKVVDGAELRWTCRQDPTLTVLQAETVGADGEPVQGKLLVTATVFAGLTSVDADLAREATFRRSACGTAFRTGER